MEGVMVKLWNVWIVGGQHEVGMFSLPKAKGINGYHQRFKKVRVLVGQTDTDSFMVGWYEVQFKCPLKIPVH